jgi:hypothetical protein
MATITTPTTGVFSGYTLGELRALVLRMLRVQDPTRFSATKASTDYDWVDDALNRAQEDFVRKTHCLRTYAILETKANFRTYRLPEDFLDLMAAYFYDSSLSDGYKELRITSIEELNDDVSDWRTSTGDPTRIYPDRNYGAGMTVGLYPIPASNGDSVTFSSDYGTAVTWVCPLYAFNQDVGVIIRLDGDDEWILPTQAGVSVDADVSDGNVLIEYFRLPQTLVARGDNTDQYSEIPREYQKALAYYASADLLSNNPADSAEFKRSQFLMAMFEKEVKTYIDRRKRPLYGRNLRAVPASWNWVKNMDFRREMA